MQYGRSFLGRRMSQRVSELHENRTITPISRRTCAAERPAARAYAKKVTSNRRRAIKFLKEAGIIDKPGILARPYR